MAKRKITATQRNINNINSYINKVGKMFGENSPEYERIVNAIGDFETYQNKRTGFVNIKNTKENRKMHQKVRAIMNSRTPYASLKRKFVNTVKELSKEFKKHPLPGGSMPEIASGTGETEESSGTRSFEDWYRAWRATWNDKEQYEVSNLASKLNIPFDRDKWYHSYAYRAQIAWKLFEAYKDDIINEANDRQTNDDGDTINPSTGQTYNYDASDLRKGFNPSFGWDDSVEIDMDFGSNKNDD